MSWIIFLYPLMELWSLIELGTQTSAATAVLWVLVAGLLGLTAIRFAGAQVLTRLHSAQREGVLQQQLLAGHMALAFAGLLLIVPGIISDAMALLILVPPLRSLLVKLIGLRGVNRGARSTHGYSQQDARASSEGGDGVTLEGEFQELGSMPSTIQPHGPDETDRS